ncbi:hypothetical protein F5877DRAFT_93729 [Lentinula edodes]|nr:hypothetical protein F5877DRAFT_93729 [Lentinula edodes]
MSKRNLPTRKPHECDVCHNYRGEKAAHLRNHLAHTGCGNALKLRNATSQKRQQTIHKDIRCEPSLSLSISSNDFPNFDASTFTKHDIPESPPPPKKPRMTVEEVTDDDFSGAGAELGGETGKNGFQRFKDTKHEKSEEMWSPFKSHKEWQLARWLMLSGVSHGDIDSFAKLPIIQDELHSSFKDKRTFVKKIDALPTVHGGWICKELEIVGNIMKKATDGTEVPMTEEVELWRRDPIECIKELMEDSRFEEHMRYAPERMFTDETMHMRAIDEMWTGDWWWATQKLLPEGSTIAPIILASDKTQLSTLSGDKSAWPGYRLFHDCMGMLLEELIVAGDPHKGGVKMLCSDGKIRFVFPLLAAYVADFPEQCLVVCCQENRCPKCTAQEKELGDPLHSILRDPDRTIQSLQKAANGENTSAVTLGLRLVTPFWASLPLCNIFHCITPDILHQLHKGVFKDHIVKWSTRAVTGKSKKEREREIDIRFQSMPRHPTLRHFKQGISLITQWTGHEYKNMEKIFLGVISGATESEEIVLCVRAILDFIEYSQFSLHTDESLEKMDEALRTFHCHKDAAFVDTGVRQAFNIPKVHSMNHYTPMILSIGAAPGYNTEWSERLHIDFAKLAYRASNRRDYIKQMTHWLDRREKVLWFTRFLDWALEKDRIDWLATREVDEEENEEAVTIPEFGEALQVEGIRTNLQYGESTCMVAKRTPVTNITIESLDSDFGCSTFVYAMERFLREQNLLRSDYWDAQPAKYSLYKQFRVIVLPTLEISNSPIVDVVHATATQPAVLSGRGKRKYTPAQFETVLARKSLPDSREDLDVLGKDGLHVAQVRAIFDLPGQLGSFPHPLAYVEWFTPLRKLDKVTRMYRVERSIRGQNSCHLVPFYGKHADPTWSSEKVLDQCEHFYLNPYLRPIDFVLLRPKDNN